MEGLMKEVRFSSKELREEQRMFVSIILSAAEHNERFLQELHKTATPMTVLLYQTLIHKTLNKLGWKEKRRSHFLCVSCQSLEQRGDTSAGEVNESKGPACHRLVEKSRSSRFRLQACFQNISMSSDHRFLFFSMFAANSIGSCLWSVDQCWISCWLVIKHGNMQHWFVKTKPSAMIGKEQKKLHRV